jgi:hypothetical protein
MHALPLIDIHPPRGRPCPAKQYFSSFHRNSSLLHKNTIPPLSFPNTNNTNPNSPKHSKHTFKMSAIPTSTSVSESAVIRAPLSHVWHLIKIQDFSKFWSALSGSEYVKGASEETDIVKWTFKDGTVIEVKQEEHSVSLIDYPSRERFDLSFRPH